MRKYVRQEDLFVNPIVQLAQTHKEQFTDDFLKWLTYNVHVWLAFEKEAVRAVGRGLKHYSARTIIEWLRHNSAVRGVADDWKLNDHITPYMARLFRLKYPEYEDFFELRKTKKVYTPEEAIA